MNNTFFGFGQALELLRQGKKVTRDGWNGKGMFIELQIPDQTSKMTEPYIFIAPTAAMNIPWVASQNDLLKEDWYEVIEESVQTEQATTEAEVPAEVVTPTEAEVPAEATA